MTETQGFIFSWVNYSWEPNLTGLYLENPMKIRLKVAPTQNSYKEAFLSVCRDLASRCILFDSSKFIKIQINKKHHTAGKTIINQAVSFPTLCKRQISSLWTEKGNLKIILPINHRPSHLEKSFWSDHHHLYHFRVLGVHKLVIPGYDSFPWREWYGTIIPEELHRVKTEGHWTGSYPMCSGYVTTGGGKKIIMFWINTFKFFC